MKGVISNTLFPVFAVTFVSWASATAMAGERTMRHTEDFTTDTYYDESQAKELLGEGEEECAGLGCQSAHGWLEEKGYVTLSRIGQTGSSGGYNRMPAPYPPAPASASPSVRPSQIVAGVFTRSLGDPDPATGTGADDAIALVFDPSASSLCHLHFLKNKGSAYPAFNPSTRSQSLNHRGFEVGYRVQNEDSDPLWDNYIIGATQQGTDNGEASGTWNCSSDADGELSGDNEYGVVLVAGDFNNDKWLDVLYMRASDRNREGRVDSAYVFINLQTVTNGVPNFKRYRLESQSELLKSGLSLHWSSPVGVAVKYHQPNSEQDIRKCESDGEEHDCRDDLVIASSYGSDLKVLLFKQKASPVFNTDSARLFEPPVDLGLAISMQDAATSTASVSTSTQCGSAAGVTRGITALDAADINGDGRTDIVLGGFHELGLQYFFTNQAGFYSTAAVPFPAGGVVGVFARDWNYDGNLDLLITRTGEGCDGANVDPNQPQEKDPAGVWVVFGDPDPNDTIRSEEDRFRSGDLQLLASLNDQLHYGVPIQLDDDEDNYIDFLTGYNPSWGSSYYYFHSEWPKLYKTAGLVQSKRIDTWDPQEHLITQVTLEEAAIEGLSPDGAMELTFMVTNNGVDWEELTPAELPPSLRPADSGCDAESARPHKFTTFGTDLRWGLKTSVARSASLSREEQVIADTAGGATKDVPRLTYVQLLSTVVEQAHYSRSALAYGEWDWGADGTPGTKYLYSASFRYPGFVGKLKAWDITNAPTEIQAGVNPGDDNPHLDAYYQWDAGEKLRLRSGSSRTFYYFTYENGTAHRHAFATGGYKLDELLDTDGVEPFLTPDEVSSLVNYVKGPMGNEDLPDGLNGSVYRDWKLRDAGHSSPVFVGKPKDNVVYWGDSNADTVHQQFVQSNQGRTPMIYIGSNGGGLHAFNAETGEEVWVMVPPNLLPKLARQRSGDDYVHQYFVDGSITVEDIFHGGSWKTVLIVGQGKGSSASGYNYYFALDVTLPENPIPLWEFTDKPANDGDYCSGDNTRLEPNCPDASCVCGSDASCLQACSLPGRVFTASGFAPLEEGVIIDAAKSDTTTGWDVSGGKVTSTSREGLCELWPDKVVNGQKVKFSINDIRTSGCTHLQFNFQVPSDKAYQVSFLIREGDPEDPDVDYEDDQPLFWYSVEDTEVFAQRADYTGPQKNYTVSPSGSSEARWVSSKLLPSLSGQSFLHLWLVQHPVEIDTIVIHEPYALDNVVPTATDSSAQRCLNICDSDQCELASVPMVDPVTQHYDECSLDYERDQNGDFQLAANGQRIPIYAQCCEYSGDVGAYLAGGAMCHPEAGSCSDISADTSLGETWSRPAVGRVSQGGTPTWVAFFGSGYNNLGSQHQNVGRSIYMVDAYEGPAVDGTPLGQWNLKEEATSVRERVTPVSGQDNDGCTPASTEIEIDNTLPGGPALVDVDTVPDGFVDRLYIGDLEGRLWKLAMDTPSGPNGNVDDWKHCVVFDAGDHDGDGVRNWAPIVTKPAVAVIDGETPNVYFGTGADDRAPDDELYRFYSVRDADNRGACSTYNGGDATISTNVKHDEDLQFGADGNGQLEWIVGDGCLNNTGNINQCSQLNLDIDEGVTGERYWSDPVIIDNQRIIFASLYGKIDQVDPTMNTSGPDGPGGTAAPSRLYCYAIRPINNLGLEAGQSCLPKQDGDRPAWEEVYAKVRQAVTVVGDEQTTWARKRSPQGSTEPPQLFFQRFSETNREGPSVDLEAIPASGNICIVHWREVPL